MLATAAALTLLTLFLVAELLYRRGEVRRALARARELAPHDVSAAGSAHARASRLARWLPERLLSDDDQLLLHLGPTALLEPVRPEPRFGTRYGPTVRELGAGDPLDRIGTRRIPRVRADG